MYRLPKEKGSDLPKEIGEVKKALQVALEDREIIELMHILLDEDAEGTLDFLKTHFEGKARDLSEREWTVLIEVPGAGIRQVQVKRLA